MGQAQAWVLPCGHGSHGCPGPHVTLPVVSLSACL